MSVAQIQVKYQTKELHMVAIILKYKKSFLIILLLYILWVVKYHEIIVWNFMELMRNKEVLVLRLMGDWNRA